MQKIVVTGGNQPGDNYTEATASANYLIQRGIPDEDVLRGLVTLDDDLRTATKVAAGDYSWDDAPAQWRRAIRELAVSLQSGWPALGITTG